jgi:signal transduction histidine kinase
MSSVSLPRNLQASANCCVPDWEAVHRNSVLLLAWSLKYLLMKQFWISLLAVYGVPVAEVTWAITGITLAATRIERDSLAFHTLWLKTWHVTFTDYFPQNLNNKSKKLSDIPLHYLSLLYNNFSFNINMGPHYGHKTLVCCKSHILSYGVHEVHHQKDWALRRQLTKNGEKTSMIGQFRPWFIMKSMIFV